MPKPSVFAVVDDRGQLAHVQPALLIDNRVFIRADARGLYLTPEQAVELAAALVTAADYAASLPLS